MARGLTIKQRKWADRKLKTGNGTQAALEVYDTKNPRVASVIAAQNVTKLSVREYLESKANSASQRMYELMRQDENLPVALGATKDILDRAGYKPVDKVLNMNIEVEVSEEIKALAERLNGV